jgi:hypothetical protein
MAGHDQVKSSGASILARTISVSTELIHPVSARSPSQPRSAADSASA